MFIMVMAETFQVGDRAAVRINGEPAELHWRDPDTLVINDTDARAIVMLERGGRDGAGRAVQTFTCDDGAPAAGDSQR